MKKFVVVIALAFFLLSPVPNTVKAQAPAGEAVYNRHCSVCHGVEGIGTDKGPPLVHKIYRSGHHADITFHFAVRRGVRTHHWRFGDMPRIEGVTEEDVEEIILYIRGIQKEAGIF